MKKLGRITSVGHRMTGDRRRQPRGAGWEFVHVAVDDYSRVAYVELLADERTESVRGFVRRALAWFRARGARIRRVLTDNGSAYLSRGFRATCRALHLAHRRTRPYTPRTNGKAERFIQTLLREWAYLRPYYTSADRTRVLPGWLEHFNCARPHAALGKQPPMSRFPGGNNLMRAHTRRAGWWSLTSRPRRAGTRTSRWRPRSSSRSIATRRGSSGTWTPTTCGSGSTCSRRRSGRSCTSTGRRATARRTCGCSGWRRRYCARSRRGSSTRTRG